MKKSLLASALATLALVAAPAAQAATTSPFLNAAPSPGPSEMPSPEPSGEMSAAPSAIEPGQPFGPGCSSLPTEGKGSPADLAGKPLGTALSEIPQLSTLDKAVKEANLVDTLNNAKDVTVFAPVDDAFNKAPKEELDKLLQHKDQLKKVLTYHIVPKKVTAEDLKSGSLDTLEGGKLTVTEANGEYTINNAKVICGNIATSNATVYLIDSILMPEAGASASPS